MRLALAIGATLLLVCLQAGAQLVRASDMFRWLEEDLARGPEEAHGVRELGQAGAALLLANGTNVKRHQEPLFCQPPDQAFRPTDFAKIAIEQYRSAPQRYEGMPIHMVRVIALYDGLQRRFPCR